MTSVLAAEPPATKPASPPVGSGTPDAKTKTPPATQPPEEAIQLPDVLLAVITDCASGRRTIQRIEILTQRPARYVQPRVEYDPQAGRVDITVQATGPLPPQGVSIACEARRPEPGQPRARAVATLQPSAAETQLHLEIPPDAGPVCTILVDADGFERAFRFEVPTDAASRTVVPQSNAVHVRILEPESGKAFGPDPMAIDVALAVDVPQAAVRDGRTSVEIGVDANRDRTLQGDESLLLTSDRQVDLFLDSTGPDGSLALRTRVSDLRATLPPPKATAGRANLIARLVLAEDVVWSDPVEVIFDDDPPGVSRLHLAPGATVVQGGDLEVSVLATDGELSGVARVEAAFDQELQGKFGAAPPVPGSLQPDGRWVIKLPTAPVSPGVYNVLVRATDRVENASEYMKTRVEVISKEADTASKSGPNQVRGRAVFGRLAKAPAAGVTVRLIVREKEKEKTAYEATTDKDGQFLFERVTPGEYKLTGQGLIRGNQRTAQADLTVPPAPTKVESVELLLDSAP
jgi:hypothetical protein